jgi:hypothetical protein
MSKSPISFTPEPSPVSSPQKPQTFDFSTLVAQKAIEKLEQEREIAQQEAWAKQKTMLLYQCYQGSTLNPSTCLSL